MKIASGENEDLQDWFQPNKANSYMNFIRVIVTTDDEACLFISFILPKDPEFRIRNFTDKEITINQPNFPLYMIEPGGLMPWAYDDLQGKRKIDIGINGDKKSYVIEKIEQMKDLGNNTVEVVVVGVTRELRITPSDSLINRLKYNINNKKTGIKLILDFKGFGISVIDKSPKEILYISMADLYLKLSVKTAVVYNETRTFTKLDLKLESMQIDNMKNSNRQFPVIFNNILRKKDEESAFLQMKLHKMNSRKVIDELENEVKSLEKFSWIEMALQEMQCQLDLETIINLINLAQDLQSSLQKPGEIADKKDALQDYLTELNPSAPILTYEDSQTAEKAYFEFLRFCAIKIMVSFRISKQKVEITRNPKVGFGVLKALTSIGSAFVNFSNSPLRFRELLIHHSFQNFQSMISQISKNYIRQGILQFYKILGSVDLLGNPIGFVDKVGVGVVEFFNEPKKGALKGPKSFAKGISKGVRSLVGNIISGSFGGVNRITGGLYGIVREFTGDPYGINRLDDQGKVLGSLYGGVKGSVQDLSEGISGVITKPIKGAKAKGTAGCIKGVGSGLVGVVAAPVSAVLRLSNGLTGCVANAGTKIARGTTGKAKRRRFPRYFGPKNILEPYNDDISSAQNILKRLHDYHKEKIVYYAHITDFRDKIVILTMNYLLILVNSDLNQAIKVKHIKILEIHSQNENFVLYCGYPENATHVQSKEFSQLAKLYSAISALPSIDVLMPLQRPIRVNQRVI